MSKIVLGLDLGITSIGWALVKVDDVNSNIIESGVRIFTIAEHPKDGKSLALPRREARGARRTIKRKAQKIRAIKRLLLQNKIITESELEHLFIGNKQQVDVWQLRRESLYRELDNKELSRIMIHLAKHRGYFSNRKSEDIVTNEELIKNTDDKENKKEKEGINSGIKNNIKELALSSYQTIGEYLSINRSQEKGKTSKKRNAKCNYQNTVARSMLEEEIELIFSKQKEFESRFVNDELLETYKEIAFVQRPLKSVAHMVGKCPFEKKEDRASKSSYSFEYFRALQKLKNIRMTSLNAEVEFSIEQIQQAVYEAKSKATPRTYKQIRKLFSIEESVKFKGLVYYDYKTGELLKKDPENAKLIDFSAYHKIKKAIIESDNLYWNEIENNYDVLDSIATILTIEKDDKESMKRLLEIIENEKVCESLLAVSFSGFGHLSNRALSKIIPELEKGLNYDDACKEAKYDFKAIFEGKKTLLLPRLSEQENVEMTNPVVKRAIAQMRLVYNAIARKYGAIDSLHIEFTRDIKKSHDDRKKIEKDQAKFRDAKDEARVHAKEILDKEPSAKELMKFRLWKEQNGECVYSGAEIRPQDLADSYATEIDHILPYSRSLDDSLNNKVLCFTKENQEKGNKTPFEYMSEDKFYEFKIRAEGYKNLKRAKLSRLTKTNFDTNSENDFKERNKNDTSYISKFIKNYIEAHVEFKESKDKRHVYTMNGMLTTQLRYKWGVGDKNRDNHLHHAEDAIILAFSTQSMVKKLSDISAKREGFIYEKKEEKSKKVRFEAPLDNFGEDVKNSISEIFVSQMPRRKVSGAGHKATVYSDKTLSVKKENGKVEVLKGGSVVNNVKLKHGIALNDGMPRVDLFQNIKTKKYYLVPIYVSDFVKDKLPNRAIVQGNKPWIEMDDEYEFRFSFYKRDLIEVKTKQTKTKESVQVLGYYDSTHSGTAKIMFKSDDGAIEYGFGVQNMLFIKKYQVDALGSFVEVRSEKRQGTIKEGRELRKKTK